MWSEGNYSGQHEFGQDVHGRGVGCAELNEMAEQHTVVNPPRYQSYSVSGCLFALGG